MPLTGTINPVRETYRWDGINWVPTHPPYVEPALFSGLDEFRVASAEVFTATDVGSTATRVDSYSSGTTNNNNFSAWLLDKSTGNKITTQQLMIPSWWQTYFLYVMALKPPGATGIAKFQVQRHSLWEGDDMSGTTNRTTSSQGSLDFTGLTSYGLYPVLVGAEADCVVPTPDTTKAIPFPWWRHRIVRSASGDTYAGTVPVVGLVAVRKS